LKPILQIENNEVIKKAAFCFVQRVDTGRTNTWDIPGHRLTNREESWSRYDDSRRQKAAIPADATNQDGAALLEELLEELQQSSHCLLPSVARTSPVELVRVRHIAEVVH
jgi:hypothetical protein